MRNLVAKTMRWTIRVSAAQIAQFGAFFAVAAVFMKQPVVAPGQIAAVFATFGILYALQVLLRTRTPPLTLQPEADPRVLLMLAELSSTPVSSTKHDIEVYYGPCSRLQVARHELAALACSHLPNIDDGCRLKCSAAAGDAPHHQPHGEGAVRAVLVALHAAGAQPGQLAPTAGQPRAVRLGLRRRRPGSLPPLRLQRAYIRTIENICLTSRFRCHPQLDSHESCRVTRSHLCMVAQQAATHYACRFSARTALFCRQRLISERSPFDNTPMGNRVRTLYLPHAGTHSRASSV